MKIEKMSDNELSEAIDYCMMVPVEDPMYSGWNFDKEELLDKLHQLLNERVVRQDAGLAEFLEAKYGMNTELAKPHNRDLLTGV